MGPLFPTYKVLEELNEPASSWKGMGQATFRVGYIFRLYKDPDQKHPIRPQMLPDLLAPPQLCGELRFQHPQLLRVTVSIPADIMRK